LDEWSRRGGPSGGCGVSGGGEGVREGGRVTGKSVGAASMVWEARAKLSEFRLGARAEDRGGGSGCVSGWGRGRGGRWRYSIWGRTVAGMGGWSGFAEEVAGSYCSGRVEDVGSDVCVQIPTPGHTMSRVEGGCAGGCWGGGGGGGGGGGYDEPRRLSLYRKARGLSGQARCLHLRANSRGRGRQWLAAIAGLQVARWLVARARGAVFLGVTQRCDGARQEGPVGACGCELGRWGSRGVLGRVGIFYTRG